MAQSNNSFEYGGFHFVPVRKLNENKKSDICAFMRNVATDVDLGFFVRDDVRGRKQKYHYSHHGFYDASGNSELDIFKCIENNKLYIPGQNELFLFLKKE